MIEKAKFFIYYSVYSLLLYLDIYIYMNEKEKTEIEKIIKIDKFRLFFLLSCKKIKKIEKEED